MRKFGNRGNARRGRDLFGHGLSGGTASGIAAPTAPGVIPSFNGSTGTGTVTVSAGGAFTGSGITYAFVGGTPAGLAISPSTGVISINRATLLPLEATFQVSATNASGSISASFSILFVPAAPLSGDWTLTDSGDGTGLTISVLSTPSWVTSVEYGILGVWTAIPASGPITIDVNNAPIGVPVSVTLRWGVGTVDGIASIEKVQTASVPANIIQYVASGTVGAAPANWSTRWATGAMTYQEIPSRLQMTTGTGVFWSLDSDSGRDLSSVSGELDFSTTLIPNATGEMNAGVCFWASGFNTGAGGDRQGYMACVRETAGLQQVALYSYIAGNGTPATVTTSTHGYAARTGPDVIWTLRVRTRLISSQWRIYIKAWPNDLAEPVSWQVNGVVFTPTQTTGRIGIASREVSSGAPLGIVSYNVGLNGADAPGTTVAAGGKYKAGAALFVDFVAGSDANPGTSSAAPLLTLPGTVDPGCVIKVRGKTKISQDSPAGGTSTGQVKLIGNDPTFAAGDPATISGESDLTTITDFGGGIWGRSLPADSWARFAVPKASAPDPTPILEGTLFFRNNTRMRIAQYPTQTNMSEDQAVRKMLPVHSSASTPFGLVVPTDLLTTIPDATTRANVIADYPAETTIRGVINAMHAVENLNVNSWLIIWGNHNTRQRARIIGYDTSTGVMTLHAEDAVANWTTAKTTYFSISNHPSALRVDNQFLAGFSSGQFRMKSSTDPNGQITYGQTRPYIFKHSKSYTTLDGFIIERGACPVPTTAPLFLTTGVTQTVTMTHVLNCTIRLCSSGEAALILANPHSCVIRGNTIEDIFGRGMLVVDGDKAVIANNTILRCGNTPLSVRDADRFVIAENDVFDPDGTHSNMCSIYNDNKDTVVVGNRMRITNNDEALNPGMTMHRLDNCIFAFNKIVTPISPAFQQWATTGPRTPTSGGNIFSNNTLIHYGPGRQTNENKAFNITSLANGQSQVTNNIANSLCFDAFEDSAISFRDPSFAWREVATLSAAINGGGSITQITTSIGDASAVQNPPVAADLVFATAGSYVDLTFPTWTAMIAGAGVDCYIDLRQPSVAGRIIPNVNAELIVTTTAGNLPTATATWPISVTANTDLSNAWQTGNTVRAAGQAGATVTSVVLRLRPGTGFVAGVSDTVLIARPRAWRDRAERLALRRKNIIFGTTQYGSTLDAQESKSLVASILKNMVGPTWAEFDLAPRETSPGVLAEPLLSAGASWTFAPAAAVGMTPIVVDWVGAVRPDGSSVDLRDVNWWGLVA